MSKTYLCLLCLAVHTSIFGQSTAPTTKPDAVVFTKVVDTTRTVEVVRKEIEPPSDPKPIGQSDFTYIIQLVSAKPPSARALGSIREIRQAKAPADWALQCFDATLIKDSVLLVSKSSGNVELRIFDLDTPGRPRAFATLARDSDVKGIHNSSAHIEGDSLENAVVAVSDDATTPPRVTRIKVGEILARSGR